MKESRERVGKTAQAIQDQAQALISDTLAPLVQLANTLNGKSLAGIYTSLHGFQQEQGTWVHRLILLDSSHHLLYPIHESRNQPASPLSPLPLEARQRMQGAEQAEFKDHDYTTALKIYKSLEKETGSLRWKALLLASEAGCLMKMKQFDAAETQYHEILSRYAQEQNEQGYPLGLVIASQVGELQQAKGRSDLAAASHLRVFQDLVTGRWDLSLEELRFYVQHLTQRLQALEPHMSEGERDRWKKLQEQWDELKHSSSEAQSFVQTRWPALQRKLTETHQSGNPTLLFAKTDAREAIAYAPAYETGTGSLHHILLAEITTHPLMQKLEQTMAQLSAASNLAYRLEAVPGTLLTESRQKPEGKRWPLHGTLTQTVPALQLAIAPLSDVPVEQAAARRRHVYVGMVILAALVILIALYATWYAMSREMEVAQLKARFVASISHELKTPLSIIGFIGQKLQLGRYESQEEIQEYYGMISEETGRLKSLIDEVLDFSRLMENRQPYHKEPTDLVVLTRETAERFRNSQKEGRVQLDYLFEPVSCVIPLDREAISRAILNLLDNAVKYSSPGQAHITLSLKQTDHTAVLDIQDEGFGIPSEELERVFERFYRARSASNQENVRGAGLGLSIVQHIVEAHQGRIELQSTVGKGSIFSIRLPLTPTHA